MNVDRADSGNLDLLRSFAVLCVLVFHLLLFFGGGRVPHGLGSLAIAVAVVGIRELPDGSWRVLCQLIARYSYGVYLAHFLLIWLAFDHLAEAPWSVQIAVFAVLLVALPVALYHLVERPMIRVGERVALALRRRTVGDHGR